VIAIENLLNNNIFLVSILLLVIICDLILKKCKLYLSNKIILVFFVSAAVAISYYKSTEINYTITFHNILISVLLYLTYNFFLIAVIFESPTLTIIRHIHNSKYPSSLNELKKKFLSEKFIKNRIKELKKNGYIKNDSKKISYTKKQFIILKFMKKIQQLQNIKDKMNG
jgi:DNA-binding HxlR family transcriptional regulator